MKELLNKINSDHTLLDEWGYYLIYHISKPNKYYVGSTFTTRINGNQKGFYLRFYHHYWSLKNNRHANRYLQRVINKYGIEGLRFEILEISSNVLERSIRELYWIHQYNSSTDGYNLTCNTNIYFKKMSPEIREQASKKVSEKLKGRRPKNLDTLRELQKRKILEYENDILIREYSSAKEAGDILNIDYKKINNYLRGITKKCRDYPNKHWVYKDGLPPRKIKYNSNSNWKKKQDG